jgi:hypothetical protein
MSNEYCRVDDVVQHIDDADARRNVLAIIIEGVSREIDRFCRRRFYVAQEARFYDWPATGVIRLRDDLVSLVSITTNAGQTLSSTDVHLRPQSGPPYMQINPAQGITFEYETTIYDAIVVTASWGYQATVPPPIRMATIVWSADIYARSDIQAMQKVSSGEIDFSLIAPVETPPVAVLPWLKSFVKRRISVVSSTERNATVLA